MFKIRKQTLFLKFMLVIFDYYYLNARDSRRTYTFILFKGEGEFNVKIRTRQGFSRRSDYEWIIYNHFTCPRMFINNESNEIPPVDMHNLVRKTKK